MRCSVEQAGEASTLLMGVTTEGAGRGSSGMAGIIQTGILQRIAGFLPRPCPKNFSVSKLTLYAALYEMTSHACYSPVSGRNSQRPFNSAVAVALTSNRIRRVLVVDDEPDMAEWLADITRRAGYDTRVAVRGDEAEETFASWVPDVALVDLMLPDANGADLVRQFKSMSPGTEVLVISGQGSIPRAVEAMKAGASYFLEKPIEGDSVLAILGRALERVDLEAENVALKRQLRDRYQFDNIIGRSRKMRELFDLVAAVADSEANILIQGENGTGKELIANALHYNSRRTKGPFIKINCAAIPKELIESELFGYRRGSFTGANSDRDGLLEQAQGGSLLLDEIGEMPSYLQTKLLRVLQEREYRPVGSDRVIRVD